MQSLIKNLSNYTDMLHIPSMTWTDVVEILIIAFLVFHIMVWIKNTRAYTLLKGILLIVVFVVLAAVFNMTTILWIVQNVTSIAVIALVVILQPELRSAMEELGQKNIFAALFRESSRKSGTGRFSDKTVNEIVRACTAMAKVKCGALIVIRQNTPLQEYIRTGIDIDAVVSSQLLINIFVKNTPLHDGAVIIDGDRVVAATCYLPLSANVLDKDLGTRHRAGVGVSEVTDSLTIIVSEETGQISIAYRGVLDRDVNGEQLRARLVKLQAKKRPNEEGILQTTKGKDQNEG